jgi:hypothetical protein
MSFVRVAMVVVFSLVGSAVAHAGAWGPLVLPSEPVACPCACSSAVAAPAPVAAVPWVDPWVDLGPDVAHPVAFECSTRDVSCIASHDDRVLSLAVMSSSPGTCERSTRPEGCEASYRMIVGDVELSPRWAGLDDPCTFVVRIDAGVARLYSPRTRENRKAVAAPGWKSAAFIGACDLTAMAGTDVTAEALPQFPWVSK